MSIVKVAQRAGVSPATVSHIINRFPSVSQDVITRVHQAMEALAYTPPKIKPGPKLGSRHRGGRGSRTGSIALVTVGLGPSWLALPVIANVVAGITRAAREEDLRLLLDEMNDTDALSSLLKNREVQGAIVVLGSWQLERFFTPLKQRLPIVQALGAGGLPTGIDHVTSDQNAIGYLALDYLQKHGCRHVAFLTNHPDWRHTMQRGLGFVSAAREAHVSAHCYFVAPQGSQYESFGPHRVIAPTLEELVAQFAAGLQRPTGLFLPTDWLTTDVYPLLRAHGLKVGEDVIVISCDNEELRLSSLHPRPASIDISPEEIGRSAVRSLLTRMENPDHPPARILIAPTLHA